MENDIDDAAEMLLIMSFSGYPVPNLAKAYAALREIGIEKYTAAHLAIRACESTGDKNFDQHVQEFCNGCLDIHKANCRKPPSG